MLVRDKVVVVTGGARGIGAALCRRFAREGARIIVADIDPAAEGLALDIGGLGVIANVGIEADMARIVSRAVDAFGRIDLFCSNAGISLGGGLARTTNAEWQEMWDVNVMAHVSAARSV